MNKMAISFADNMTELADLPIYDEQKMMVIFIHALAVMNEKITHGLVLPYFQFDNLTAQNWMNLPKSLDIYVCGTGEGRELNLDARGKDYATNILSYPSGLSDEMCVMMNAVPLGELVICHDVVVREASEQGKNTDEHLAHLITHGILHLLGFDHELGQDEQDEMEGFEIEILNTLGIHNPYE